MFQNSYRGGGGGGGAQKFNVLTYGKKFKKGRVNDLSKGKRTGGAGGLEARVTNVQSNTAMGWQGLSSREGSEEKESDTPCLQQTALLSTN